jgi:hypothetical protein
MNEEARRDPQMRNLAVVKHLEQQNPRDVDRT